VENESDRSISSESITLLPGATAISSFTLFRDEPMVVIIAAAEKTSPVSGELWLIRQGYIEELLKQNIITHIT
jgi:hypothetical protein